MLNFNGHRNLLMVNLTHWEALKNKTTFSSNDLIVIFGYVSKNSVTDAVRKGNLPPPTIKGRPGNPKNITSYHLWDNVTITKEIERREKINQIMLKAIADIQTLAIA